MFAPREIATPFDPSAVERIGDRVFRKKARIGTDARESHLLGAKFHESVAAMAGERGIDFDALTPAQQIEYEMAMLKGLYSVASRARILSREVKEQTFSSQIAIDVSPNTTRVQLAIVENSNKTAGNIELDFVQKRMLGYFVGLTLAKVDRLIIPWITRAELASFTHDEYTRDQLDAHMFTPLAKAGLLEMSPNRGYRLECDPESVRRVLRSDSDHEEVEVTGFARWLGENSTLLLPSHLLPLIEALRVQLEGSDAGQYLDIAKLGATAGLSRDRLYTNMRLLESQGAVSRTRRDSRYTKGDINWDLVLIVSSRNREPIDIIVTLDKQRLRYSNIEEGRTESHRELLRDLTEFPNKAWADANVDVKHFEIVWNSLSNVLDVLTSDLAMQEVLTRDNQRLYSKRLPAAVYVDRATMLGILDYLGIGPGEIARIDRASVPTLAALLRSIEGHTTYMQDARLVLEVKTRLAGLLYGQIREPAEVQGISTGELISDLEESVHNPAKRLTVAPELAASSTPVSQEATDTTLFELRTRHETPQAELYEGLLEAMKNHFDKELLFATSQEVTPTGLLMPTAAFNYHRSLSAKTDRIPWQELKSLGLAYDSERDHHPLFEPVGALIAALYLNSNIQARALVVSRGRHEAIVTIARHTAHLLRASVGETEGKVSNEKLAYIKHSLKTLARERVSCLCSACMQAV